MSEYSSSPSNGRLLIVSHPAVLTVNQLVYAELASRGWHVTVVVPKRWRHSYSVEDLIPEPLPALADSVRPLPIVFPGRPQRHFYVVNPIALIRSLRPDVMFCEQEPSSLAALQWGAAARLAGVPFGVQAAENLDRFLPRPVRASRRWILRNAAFVAARSPTAASLVRLWGAQGQVELVPHYVPGWDVGTRLQSDFYRVGYVGRLVPEKGLDTLVEAVGRLDGPTELIVAGNGPLRGWLEGQRMNGKRLRLLTGIPHNEMAAVYAAMDVLVLPSKATATWVEQFGRVLVEALWCGIPVVGSDTGEIPWVIHTTQGGLVFREGDAGALASILDDLRLNPSLRDELGANGAKHAHDLFSIESVASLLSPLLKAAVVTDESHIPK